MTASRGCSRRSNEYALVVLDVMLRGSCFEVLRRIRSVSKIPVLLLTARGEDVDRIVGLESERTIIFRSRLPAGVGGANPRHPAPHQASQAEDAVRRC